MVMRFVLWYARCQVISAYGHELELILVLGLATCMSTTRTYAPGILTIVQLSNSRHQTV